MPAKTDDPTGVNWNGAATNERERVGVVIEHLLLFFIRFRTVPMATDGGVSQPPHLQATWFHNRAKTQKAPREKRGAFLFPSARADWDPLPI